MNSWNIISDVPSRARRRDKRTARRFCLRLARPCQAPFNVQVHTGAEGAPKLNVVVGGVDWLATRVFGSFKQAMRNSGLADTQR
jgi:hypothetical protein